MLRPGRKCVLDHPDTVLLLRTEPLLIPLAPFELPPIRKLYATGFYAGCNGRTPMNKYICVIPDHGGYNKCT
jgi:hypothetical protein